MSRSSALFVPQNPKTPIDSLIIITMKAIALLALFGQLSAIKLNQMEMVDQLRHHSHAKRDAYDGDEHSVSEYDAAKQQGKITAEEKEAHKKAGEKYAH